MKKERRNKIFISINIDTNFLSVIKIVYIYIYIYYLLYTFYKEHVSSELLGDTAFFYRNMENIWQ